VYDGSNQKDVTLIGYTDADWGTNPIGRESQSGNAFLLCGGVISWASKKQPTVALSSTESEYVAASGCAQEPIWLRALRCVVKNSNSSWEWQVTLKNILLLLFIFNRNALFFNVFEYEYQNNGLSRKTIEAVSMD